MCMWVVMVILKNIINWIRNGSLMRKKFIAYIKKRDKWLIRKSIMSLFLPSYCQLKEITLIIMIIHAVVMEIG